ncbi:MAG: hypothetical protein ACYTGZ_17570, partial [Planctomycetota bacterium]
VARSAPVPSGVRAAMERETTALSRGTFDWQESNEAFLASHWLLFLKVEFGVPGWSVVLSESKETFAAPIDAMEQTLVAVGILTIAVVSLLSIVLIRRTLGPIDVLKSGTRRIIATEFTHRVQPSSLIASR